MVPRFTFREAVAEAHFHDGPYWIMGRQLDPFCYRHFRFLEDYGSPLVHGGKPSITDLQVALIVCSTRDLSHFRAAVARKSIYWKVWARFTSQLVVEFYLPKFKRYIEDYFPEFPMYTTPGSDVDEEGIPGLTVAAARCLPALGYDKTTSMPLGEMLIWSMASAAANGHRFENIMQPVDIEGLREIDAEEKLK